MVKKIQPVLTGHGHYKVVTGGWDINVKAQQGERMWTRHRALVCDLRDLPWKLLESPCSVFFISLFFLLTLFYWLSHLECKLQERKGGAIRGSFTITSYHLQPPSLTEEDPDKLDEAVNQWANEWMTHMLYNSPHLPEEECFSKKFQRLVWRRIWMADMGNKEATITQHCPGWSMAPGRPPTVHGATSLDCASHPLTHLSLTQCRWTQEE